MSNQLVQFSNYGRYSSDNYGVNSLRFDLPNITVYFSYQTVIAFTQNGKTYVSENRWGKTTGKHLNWIDGGNKKTRLARDEFESLLAQATAGSLH